MKTLKIFKKPLGFIVITMLCLVVVTLFATVGCDKSETPPVESYPREMPFIEYSLAETSCQWQWTNFGYNKVIIINSDKELQDYIICTDDNYSKIDFSEHSLLLAMAHSTSGIRYINIDFLKETANEYTLNVLIHADMTALALGRLISIITPKIDNGATILLSVQQTND
ncbi:MAG: hypothetical protein FWF52_05375 [Candidatus Azobacteroides sp.]|nr:hypothetical protein [Candidatus Azobacteroides sp.]